MRDLDDLGGEPAIEALVARFYERLESDPRLRPMYPQDLEPSRRHLTLFLIQYWGGPDTYSRLRGHPRLRLRHQPFDIGPVERDAWLTHMRAALDALDIDAAAKRKLWGYLEMAARSLVNRPVASA